MEGVWWKRKGFVSCLREQAGWPGWDGVYKEDFFLIRLFSIYLRDWLRCSLLCPLLPAALSPGSAHPSVAVGQACHRASSEPSLELRMLPLLPHCPHVWQVLCIKLPLEVLVHACWVTSVVSDCDPVDCSLPGSSVRGILQARILEWVALSSSRGSS